MNRRSGGMITFNFLPRSDDPSWRPDGLPEKSARELTANDLTFDYFNADVVIDDGENEIHLRTPDLPVIDFVLMLVQLYREVVSAGESIVETTQTQDTVRAIRVDNEVEISYSFSSHVSVVSFDEFEEIPQAALTSALNVLYSAHDEFRMNPYVSELARLVRPGEPETD